MIPNIHAMEIETDPERVSKGKANQVNRIETAIKRIKAGKIKAKP